MHHFFSRSRVGTRTTRHNLELHLKHGCPSTKRRLQSRDPGTVVKGRATAPTSSRVAPRTTVKSAASAFSRAPHFFLGPSVFFSLPQFGHGCFQSGACSAGYRIICVQDACACKLSIMLSDHGKTLEHTQPHHFERAPVPLGLPDLPMRLRGSEQNISSHRATLLREPSRDKRKVQVRG